MQRIFDKRLLANIIIEAETPIIIGAGQKNEFTDAEILKDVNGLPYIPGATIAGILRHSVNPDLASRLFGEDDRNDWPHGSEIIFSEAKLIDGNGRVVDGLQEALYNDDFLRHYARLPIRNHVRISGKGVAEDTGKFDEEVIFKGTRFAFEIEMIAESSQDRSEAEDILGQIVDELSKTSFRIGGGSRKGFGKIRVISASRKTFDLNIKSNLDEYLKIPSELTQSKEGWAPFEFHNGTDEIAVSYHLTLTPQDFFYFGSGVGDDDADDTPVKESIVAWTGGKGTFKDVILIPAASLKGALAHRVAFHYNLSHGNFAEGVEGPENYSGSENPAVQYLFGDNQNRGKVIFNDILSDVCSEEKILNHVKIDRFTGGAMDGALFSEKVIYSPDARFETEIHLLGSAQDDKYDESLKALESSLDDLDNGTLPLGGGNGRGNGIFKCEIRKRESK